MKGMKRIVLAYFNAGGGHRAAARALEDTIRDQKRPWYTTILDVDAVLESRSRRPRDILARPAIAVRRMAPMPAAYNWRSASASSVLSRR